MTALPSLEAKLDGTLCHTLVIMHLVEMAHQHAEPSQACVFVDLPSTTAHHSVSYVQHLSESNG